MPPHLASMLRYSHLVSLVQHSIPQLVQSRKFRPRASDVYSAALQFFAKEEPKTATESPPANAKNKHDNQALANNRRGDQVLSALKWNCLAAHMDTLEASCGCLITLHFVISHQTFHHIFDCLMRSRKTVLTSKAWIEAKTYIYGNKDSGAKGLRDDSLWLPQHFQLLQSEKGGLRFNSTVDVSELLGKLRMQKKKKDLEFLPLPASQPIVSPSSHQKTCLSSRTKQVFKTLEFPLAAGNALPACQK